jgi:hypothetical protein
MYSISSLTKIYYKVDIVSEYDYISIIIIKVIVYPRFEICIISSQDIFYSCVFNLCTLYIIICIVRCDVYIAEDNRLCIISILLG